MTLRRRSLALALFLVIAACGALLLRPESGGGRRQDVTLSGDTLRVASAARGFALRLDLEDEERVSSSMGEAGRLVLEGTLVFETLADGREVIALRSLSHADVRFGAVRPFLSVEEAEAALTEDVLVVERDAHGSITRFARPEGASPFAMHVLELVALLTQHGDAERERTPHGVAEREVREEGGARVRSLVAYAPLEGAGDRSASARASGTQRIEEDDEGLVRFASEESIDWSGEGERRIRVRSEVRLERVDGERVALRVPGALVEHAPGEEPPDAELARRLDLSQADGMSEEELATTIAVFGQGGRVPDEARFMWRATGFLRAHPEASRAIEALFLAPDSTDDARRLVMDVLSGAGCRDAVLRLLESDTVMGSELEGELLERAAFLDAPGAALARHVEARLAAASDRDLELASAYALGNVARSLAEADPAAATSARAALAARLDAAREPELAAHFITALGAAAAAADVPRIAAHAEHDDVRVRESVARALGRTRTPRGRARLLSMVRDGERAVAESALRSLAEQDLDAASVVSLAEAVEQGAVSAQALAPLAPLLRTMGSVEPEATHRIASALAASDAIDSTSRAQIAGVLAVLEGRPLL